MRFLDNNDGIVTDTTTGLVWLKDLTGLDYQTWEEAKETCAVLGVAGGGWRVPTVKELLSLADYSQYAPALPEGHPFSGVQSYFYWSSSTYVSYPSVAWRVYLLDGGVSHRFKGSAVCVWPVRGGS